MLTAADDQRRKQRPIAGLRYAPDVWHILIDLPHVKSRLWQNLEVLPQCPSHALRCHFLRCSSGRTPGGHRPRDPKPRRQVFDISQPGRSVHTLPSRTVSRYRSSRRSLVLGVELRRFDHQVETLDIW
jgi:hypothetical protein